jgi:hypothetical protein
MLEPPEMYMSEARPGDVDETLCVHMAEIAGAEPAVAEGFRIGLGVVVIAGEHRRADHADLALLACRISRPSSPWIWTCMPVRSKPQVPMRALGPSSGSCSAAAAR